MTTTGSAPARPTHTIEADALGHHPAARPLDQAERVDFGRNPQVSAASSRPALRTSRPGLSGDEGPRRPAGRTAPACVEREHGKVRRQVPGQFGGVAVIVGDDVAGALGRGRRRRRHRPMRSQPPRRSRVGSRRTAGRAGARDGLQPDQRRHARSPSADRRAAQPAPARAEAGGGDGGGGIQQRRPVGLHPVAERVLQEHQRRHASRAASSDQAGIARATRGAPRATMPAPNSTAMQRRRQPDLAAEQLAEELQRRGPGAQSPARPPCLSKARPSHARRSRRAPARTAQRRQRGAGPGLRAPQPGPQRTAPQQPEPARRAAAGRRCICCPARARPRHRPPATSAPLPVAWRRPSAHSAAVQNSSSGVSGVMVTAPTPNSSVAFSSTAAAGRRRRPGSRSSAAATSSSEPSAGRSGASRRTPSAPSPARRCRRGSTAPPSADGRDSRAPSARDQTQ